MRSVRTFRTSPTRGIVNRKEVCAAPTRGRQRVRTTSASDPEQCHSPRPYDGSVGPRDPTGRLEWLVTRKDADRLRLYAGRAAGAAAEATGERTYGRLDRRSSSSRVWATGQGRWRRHGPAERAGGTRLRPAPAVRAGLPPRSRLPAPGPPRLAPARPRRPSRRDDLSGGPSPRPLRAPRLPRPRPPRSRRSSRGPKSSHPQPPRARASHPCDRGRAGCPVGSRPTRRS